MKELMIPRNVINDLIATGEAGSLATPESLADPDVAWRTLMCGGVEPLITLGRQLGEADLRHLIMGLVLFSKDSGRSGGSVSPVINLYYVYHERFPGTEPEIADWIVSNRRNGYEPFGTKMHPHARSWEQLMASRRTYEMQKMVRQEFADQAAAALRKAKATPKLPEAVRRGDILAVQALVAKGADLHVRDSMGHTLIEIADNNGREKVAEYLRTLIPATPAV